PPDPSSMPSPSPYTTLFRSVVVERGCPGAADADGVRDEPDPDGLLEEGGGDGPERDPGRRLAGGGPLEHGAGLVEPVLGHPDQRSEEHTSELQSRENIVCRL